MAEQQPNPLTTARINQIQVLLRQEAATSVAGSLGQLLAAGGMLIGVGVVLAAVITIVFFSFSAWWTAWWSCFSIYLLILTPLLIWYERRSRADYLGTAVEGMDGSPASVGERKLNQLSTGAGMIAELLVWGPRGVIDGIRGLRGLATVKQRAAFDRASILALDLYKAQAGVEIKRLVHPPEEMQVFGDAIDLLDKHGWIGKSTDGKSLWLNSTWRAKLLAAMPK